MDEFAVHGVNSCGVCVMGNLSICGGLGGLVIPGMPSSESEFKRVAMVAAKRLADELEAIGKRMYELRKATRDVPGWRISLDVQKRRNSNTLTLRWRHTTGAYVPESEVMTWLRDYPQALRDWYRSVQAYAIWLNTSERVCRRASLDYEDLALSVRGVLEQHPNATGEAAGVSDAVFV